jgi:hypothetical protein
MDNSPTMKTMVGNRNARAASPRPRRLASVTSARVPRHSGTVADDRAGNAEVSSPMPAAIDTATVRV